MKISVVTVCKNAEKVIGNTIKSVLMQKGNGCEYEYLIQDGNSQDNTLRIANGYEGSFSKFHISYKVYSELDAGIYDGMNKAVEKCSGDWIIFLNAGDTFYDDKILSYFVRVERISEYDIAIGHTNYLFSSNSKELIVTRNHNDIYEGVGICQQSIFYKKELLNRRKFDLKYKLLADYEYLLYMKTQNFRFLNINIIIANYDYNGLSSIKCQQVYQEKKEIMEQYGIIYKKRRSKIYLMVKEKLITRFPILNLWQTVRTELNRGGAKCKRD